MDSIEVNDLDYVLSRPNHIEMVNKFVYVVETCFAMFWGVAGVFLTEEDARNFLSKKNGGGTIARWNLVTQECVELENE